MANLTHTAIADHFSAKVRRNLLKRGVAIIGLTTIPGVDPFTGKASYMYNTQTGYCLSDNGTHRIKTYFEVEALAEGK